MKIASSSIYMKFCQLLIRDSMQLQPIKIRVKVTFAIKIEWDLSIRYSEDTLQQ